MIRALIAKNKNKFRLTKSEQYYLYNGQMISTYLKSIKKEIINLCSSEELEIINKVYLKLTKSSFINNNNVFKLN